jgi:hypothetical protein
VFYEIVILKSQVPDDGLMSRSMLKKEGMYGGPVLPVVGTQYNKAI